MWVRAQLELIGALLPVAPKLLQRHQSHLYLRVRQQYFHPKIVRKVRMLQLGPENTIVIKKECILVMLYSSIIRRKVTKKIVKLQLEILV